MKFEKKLEICSEVFFFKLLPRFKIIEQKLRLFCLDQKFCFVSQREWNNRLNKKSRRFWKKI